jgi:c-di-GMP-binding flagellar brake protein YcgR
VEKDYHTVHIESRGTVENWEPISAKSPEAKIDYKGPERRVERRYSALQKVEICFGRGSVAKISDRRYYVQNISKSGACFISGISLSRSESLRLRLHPNQQEFIEIQAKVIWCKPVPAQALFIVGVQFTRLGALAEKQLQELLKFLYAISPPV